MQWRFLGGQSTDEFLTVAAEEMTDKDDEDGCCVLTGCIRIVLSIDLDVGVVAVVEQRPKKQRLPICRVDFMLKRFHEGLLVWDRFNGHDD